MRKLIICLLSILMVSSLLVLAGCDGSGDSGYHLHDYKEAQTVSPTCTDDGYTVYTCECGDSYQNAVNKLNHDITTSKTPAKCGVAGEEVKSCTREGCTYKEVTPIKALEHDVKVTTTPATCTEDGSVVKTCRREGCTYKEESTIAGGHVMLEETAFILKDPTCTEKGVIKTKCSKCHEFFDTEIDELGHEYETTTVDPTETEMGYDDHTCTREHCGHNYKDNYVDPLGDSNLGTEVETPDEWN